jgi:type VI protein secretion system component Hcp
MDQVAFDFGRIEVEYRPQRPDGTPDPPVKAGWDLKANKKI